MKYYEEPKIEVQEIVVEDVITTSTDCPNQTDWD